MDYASRYESRYTRSMTESRLEVEVSGLSFKMDGENFEQRVAVSKLTDLGLAAYDYVVNGHAGDLLKYDLEEVQREVEASRAPRRSADADEPEVGSKDDADRRPDSQKELDAGMRAAMYREGYGSDITQSTRFARLAKVIGGASLESFKQFAQESDESPERDQVPYSLLGQHNKDRARLREKGACRDTGELMFATSEVDVRRAREVCIGCGIKDLCGVASITEISPVGTRVAISEKERSGLVKDLGGITALREAVTQSGYGQARGGIMEAFMIYTEAVPEEFVKKDYEDAKGQARRKKRPFEKDGALEKLPSVTKISRNNLKVLAQSIRAEFTRQGIVLPPPLKRRSNKPKEGQSKKAA